MNGLGRKDETVGKNHVDKKEKEDKNERKRREKEKEWRKQEERKENKSTQSTIKIDWIFSFETEPKRNM